MKVLNCGTLVNIKVANITAIITCVVIRFDKVSYELTYYSDLEQHIIFANEFEFEIINGDRSTIGFYNGK